jgi:hypothetical protein
MLLLPKKIFFARPKSANYAIKLLFISSNLSTEVAALVLFAWLHREVITKLVTSPVSDANRASFKLERNCGHA